MALTYVNIASQTLGSTQTSVTFSSIPATYTDLVVRGSARTPAGSFATSQMLRQINGTTTTIYSDTPLLNSGNAPYTVIRSNQTQIQSASVNSSGSTANTFNNFEIYIPSYLLSQNKPIISHFAQENNSATQINMGIIAALWRNTGAINSIDIYEFNGSGFSAGSSFYLYGIKNS